MEQVRRSEPGRVEVVRGEAVGGPTIRHEGALAVGRHDDADPSGRDPGHPAGPDDHPIRPERLDQGLAGSIPAHCADQLGRDTEAAKPASRSRGGAALAQPDHAGHIRSMGERLAGLEHDIEGQVTQDDDPGA